MLDLLARTLDPASRVVRTWSLPGDVSAFELEGADGQRQRLVVRRHGPRDLARNPNIAADEFRLLNVVQAAGVPVPTPRLSAPCLVVDYVEGEVGPAGTAFVAQFAAALLRIHAVEADVSFLPRRVLAGTRNRPVLLHGDFWPGNTLWRDGRLVAVLDWEDAGVGDPLADVANARLELLWALGLEAMEHFTDEYRSAPRQVDMTDLPYWDLRADLRLTPRITEWGLDDTTEKVMRERREMFVTRSLEQLAERR
jgi:aminoglycoside phosphotransferase (APT) family kinase protein